MSVCGGKNSLLLGVQIGAVTMENSMEAPQKIKNRTTIWSRNSVRGYISKEMKIPIQKNCVYLNVHNSIIYKSQDMEANSVYIDK